MLKNESTAKAQMSRLFAEGGMMDNSGEVVNGVEVPPGSLREEVADDVPAMLSEGEFVIPADVVRFIGLERLMKLRDEAKEGLSRMEQMGQMGNAEEVDNPDQQFEEDDDEFESNIDSIMAEVDQEQSSQQTEQMFAAGGFVTGSDLSKAPKNPMTDVRYYKHDDGRVMFITHINGKPMTAIPDGFKEVSAQEAQKVGAKADAAAAQTAKATSASNVGGDSGGGFEAPTGTPTGGGKITDPMAPFTGPYNMSMTRPSTMTMGKGLLGLVTMNPMLLSSFVKDLKNNKNQVGVVDPAYERAMLDSASAVASGSAPLSGSPFGSLDEAKAVAEKGFMSDAHFDAVINSVNTQLDSSRTSGFDMSTAADTGVATNAAGQTVSNDATIAAQNEAIFGAPSDTGGGGGGMSESYGSTSYGGEQYGDMPAGTYAQGGLVKRRKKKK